jgi:ketosteroid isomerase-like protein
MSAEYVEAIRQSLDAWNRGDRDAWLAAAHPDIEWVSEIVQRVEGQVYRGHEEMRRYWDDWHAIWDVDIDVTDFLDLGDTVVVLACLKTRGVSSGIEVERPAAYVFEFEDGMARRARAYLDQRAALASVGVDDRSLDDMS